MAEANSDRSYWNATAVAPDFPQLQGDIHCDIAVIGGGIVGIATARLLRDKGLSVAVVEAHRVGRQVTGKSTAKLTSQHRLLYHTLTRSFGEHLARLYAEAQEAGLNTLKSLVERYGIDCDLEPKAAYVYTRDEDHVDAIEQEAEVARKLGLPAALVRQTDLPIPVLAALRFDNQAQFHPTKFVAGLAQTIPGDGCHVFEYSPVVDWEPTRIRTDLGSVTARHVVMATHLPLGKVGGYFAEAHPYAEPVLAAPIRTPPEGMYISAEEPTRSIRTHRLNGLTFAIVAGSSFKPGHTEKEREAFAELEGWLTGTFDAGPIAYRWVNEDYSSMDRVPFIGWSSSNGDSYLVATGFGAWGLSNGMAAAAILADLAVGQKHPWLELFDATRIKPIAAGPRFVKENLGIAAHLIGGYLSRRPRAFDALAPGEAAILNINGEKIAAFKDEKGEVHAVSAQCSHMGCLVGWNETDRTWDCHCHGSRFEIDGEVLHGPAVTPLAAKQTQSGGSSTAA